MTWDYFWYILNANAFDCALVIELGIVIMLLAGILFTLRRRDG